jgi:hypothetical protein
MTTTVAMPRMSAARQNRSLSLGGSQLSSKRHLSLSERLSARPNRYRSFVVWDMQAMPTAEGGATSPSLVTSGVIFPLSVARGLP